MSKFKKGKTCKVKLLTDAYGSYGQPYGKAGDVIELTHDGDYRGEPDCLYVVEGHGYGTPFHVGKSIEVLGEVRSAFKAWGG